MTIRSKTTYLHTDENDQGFLRLLQELLTSEFGAEFGEPDTVGPVGSQIITTWRVMIAGDEFTLKAETYMGFSLTGQESVVDEIVTKIREKWASHQRINRATFGAGDSRLAMRGGLSTPEGNAYHIAALKYCLHVLEKKEIEDTHYSWLWKLKHNVALHCISVLQRYVDSQPPPRDVQLTDHERQHIEQTHPLLQNTTLNPRWTEMHEHEAWFQDLRTRVETYMNSVADQAHSEPDNQEPWGR